MIIPESIAEMITESDMDFTILLFPPMYQFLIDDFRAHLATAQMAKKANDYTKYLAELEEAQIALSDFKTLVNEFRVDKGPITL